jgi:integrase/recombinase XerD
VTRIIARRKQHVLRRKPRMPARTAAVDPARANLIHAYKTDFLEATLAIGLSPYTAGIRERAIDTFIRWADERGLNRPQDVTRPILQRYQRFLYHYRKSDGAPLAYSTQASLLNPVRAFFKWLTVENHLLYNPAADIEVPKMPRQLPKVLLTVADVESILAQPDVETPMGLRNRAMLETFYSTGIRRLELARLKLYDVDTERGTLMVRQGKGRKDRLVPIGERACRWIDRYLAEVRPQLILEPDHGALFVTDYGEAFEKNRLGDMVKRYMRLAGFEHGACHAFRHAMATHMLEGGCDIRYIQAMLGHSELSTTEIYTQVSIGKLKEIHAATHPARLGRLIEKGLPSQSGSPEPRRTRPLP